VVRHVPITRRQFLKGLLGLGVTTAVGGAYALLDPFPLVAAPLRHRALPSTDGPILVLAPHPDDETIGSGGTWHRFVRQGRDVHVAVVTMGDDFRTDVERLYLTLRPTPREYRALGERRRRESEAACRLLGLPPGRLSFLGFPDGGTAAMFLDHWDRRLFDARTDTDRDPYQGTLIPAVPYEGRAELRALSEVLAAVRPTTVILPHPEDLHPDHWATHAFAITALEALRQSGAAWAGRALLLTYLVHWGDWPLPMGYHPDIALEPPWQFRGLPFTWYKQDLAPALVELKEDALLLYRTQMAIMKDRILAFDRRNELFALDGAILVPDWPGSWRSLGPEIVSPHVTVVASLFGVPRAVRAVDVAKTSRDIRLRLVLGGRLASGEVAEAVLTAIHPDFPDGVRRITVSVTDRRLLAAGEGLPAHGAWWPTARTLADGSLEIRLPRAALGPATAFVLGGLVRRGGHILGKSAFRLFRLEPVQPAGVSA
jgi:LmbE family N-acetylglucosaminyl deacetylase